MPINIDRRTIHGEPDDAAIERLRAGREAWLDRELELARLVSTIDRKGAHVFEGAATVAELASRAGYDDWRIRDLVLLGHAVHAQPLVEELLRANRIGFQAACALGRILPHPAFLRPGDDWLRWAEFGSLRDLRRGIQHRIEEVRRQTTALQVYTAIIDDDTRMDLDRCQEVASGRAKKALTRGETLADVARSYLEQFDQLEKACAARRVGPTSERPHGRYVPAAVLHAIYLRSGGLCEVGDCTRPIEEICHFTPHAEGSGREEKDLFGGCHRHHGLYDAKLLRLLEWSADGRPIFINSRQESIYPAPRDRRSVPGGWIESPAPDVTTTPPAKKSPEATSQGATSSDGSLDTTTPSTATPNEAIPSEISPSQASPSATPPPTGEAPAPETPPSAPEPDLGPPTSSRGAPPPMGPPPQRTPPDVEGEHGPPRSRSP